MRRILQHQRVKPEALYFLTFCLIQDLDRSVFHSNTRTRPTETRSRKKAIGFEVSVLISRKIDF